MSLLEQGFRFYSSPDRKEARWIHPADKAHFHPNWVDVTDLTQDELLAFFTHQQLPHGPAECRAVQLDIFNDSKESAA